VATEQDRQARSTRGSDHMGSIRRVAMIGNHLPRQCGIATFTTHLSDALGETFPEVDCFVVAMNEVGKHHAYPSRVRFEIADGDVAAYRRASDFLNVNLVDVVCLQHEYGIFGGKAGKNILALLRELRMPIVTTLHTVLAEPNPLQRAVMNDLCQLSERIVVMSSHAVELLGEVHGVDEHKVDLIPHGIFAMPSTSRGKDRLGVGGKSVILTFGLLSPDKGIENVIDALPAILARCPETVYVVLGATHPHVKERHGETYRFMLETRAQRLGVEASIIFHNRFVTQEELGDFLTAADIYITPYLKPEQITSGTLAYAAGAGKAVISTPYSYARELLADGRGILVPWRDPQAIAREAIDLLENAPKRLALGERAAAYGKAMLWPAVARRHMDGFELAVSSHATERRTSFQTRTLASRPAELPEMNLGHVLLMTDSTGMLQHASFDVPRYDEGYCLDDNARALHLMALLRDEGTEDERIVRTLGARYLAFVNHAFDYERGRFRNFLSYARTWLEDQGSEDSHGRALWALGTVVGRSTEPGRPSLGGRLFHAALHAAPVFTSPRAWAFTLLGIQEYWRAFHGDSSVESVEHTLAHLLHDLYLRVRTPDWTWFEDRVTYSNARLPQALIVCGAQSGNDAMVTSGIEALEWLVKIQFSDDGYFAPIGSNGFYRRGELKPSFDQQPVDACAMVCACLEAQRATGEGEWLRHARHALAWFLGQNQLQESLYDPTTGGCRDGLHPDRVNENQGAESTLSFLLALLEMRSADRVAVAHSNVREMVK
jgi:glycosyltransferase involved in cell wall biosynthesis